MAKSKQSAMSTFVERKVKPDYRQIDWKDTKACLIASRRFGQDVWLAFDDGWLAGDNLPVFYSSELEFLREKSQAEMNKIMNIKLAIPGSAVRK